MSSKRSPKSSKPVTPLSNKIYSSAKFIKLRNKWYTKLTNSGFHDLEWHDPATSQGQNSPFLSQKLPKLAYTDYLSIYNYYNYARSFLRHGKFKTAVHRLVWRYHSQGFTYREIIKKLAAKDISRSLFTISRIINHYKPQAHRLGIDQDNKKHLESAPPHPSSSPAANSTEPAYQSLKKSAPRNKKLKKSNKSLISDTYDLDQPDTADDYLPENNIGVLI